MSKKLSFIFSLIGLYLVSTGISFAVFNFTKVGELSVFESPVPEVSQSPVKSGFGPIVTLVGPKDQICPINGEKFTKTEKELWQVKRPLLVMIENHEDSRPQSGLSKADVVYEAVAEGAITRFMAVFYCGNAAYSAKGSYDIGPVRSARTYFLDWASEYSDFPLYNHVGGSNCSEETPGGPCTTDRRAQALEQIKAYGWLEPNTKSDLNQYALGYSVCRGEPDRTGKEVATEHTKYCSTEALWTTAVARGLTNVNYKGVAWDKNYRSWLFKDDAPSSGSVSPEFDFWRDYKAYAVRWNYDKTTNSYKRVNGGEPFIDFNNKEQIAAKNVIIQFAKETGPLDIHKHLLYETIGTGKALIFQDGLVIEGKWSKKSRIDRTLFYDSTGSEVKFNRGQIWIEVLPTTGKVNY
jgi:hypothetical protein